MSDVASEAERPMELDGMFLAVAASALVTQAYPSSILREQKVGAGVARLTM